MQKAVETVVSLIMVPILIAVTATVAADPNAEPLTVTALGFVTTIYTVLIIWHLANAFNAKG